MYPGGRWSPGLQTKNDGKRNNKQNPHCGCKLGVVPNSEKSLVILRKSINFDSIK
jgi:hypothetical protein